MTAEVAREILKLRYPGDYIIVRHDCVANLIGVKDSETFEVYASSKGWSGASLHTSHEDAIDALLGKMVEKSEQEGEHGTEKS